MFVRFFLNMFGYFELFLNELFPNGHKQNGEKIKCKILHFAFLVIFINVNVEFIE